MAKEVSLPSQISHTLKKNHRCAYKKERITLKLGYLFDEFVIISA